MTDEELQRFLADGQIDVLGNSLGPDDLRLFYQFTGPRATELAQQYETQAEKDVCQMLTMFNIFPESLTRWFKNCQHLDSCASQCVPRPKYEG